MRLTNAALIGVCAAVGACTSIPNPDREQVGSVVTASGHAVLECVMGADGRGPSCRVKEEHPAGHGIGREAIRRLQHDRGIESLEVAGTKFTVRVPVEATALAEPTNR